jgi:cytoskeletal protein CcmA (bactofilin family)
MFKKTEESEWTRFSRALGGKDQPREADEEIVPEEDAIDAGPTMVSPPAPVEPAPEPIQPVAARPVLPDAELPIERPVRPPAPPPAEPARPPAWTSAAAEDSESVIGQGTTIDGSVRSESSIRIHGSVQGEIESRQRVVVEPGAQVNAKITAQHISVSGDVSGELSCPGRVEITPGGRVTGEISAGALVMQEGAYFEGHLKMLNKGGPADGDTRRVDVEAGV